jgi:hypothetical protein
MHEKTLVSAEMSWMIGEPYKGSFCVFFVFYLLHRIFRTSNSIKNIQTAFILPNEYIPNAPSAAV